MSVTVLYGSQSGTAERLAFRVARMALNRGATTARCLPADDTNLADWVSYCVDGGHVVFVLANANQGEAPETYRRSWAQLLSRDAPAMAGLSYAIFGLGDSLYAKFNYMAKMTHNRLKQLRATPLLLRGLGDESDAKGLDEALLPWLSQLWAALGYAGANASVPQDPLDAKFFPLYAVKVAAAAEAAAPAGLLSCVEGVAETPRREATFLCAVTANTRLTTADHFQAVHHIDMSAATEVSYEVGDALGVYCPNRPELVDQMLAFCELSGEEHLTITPRCDTGLVEQTKRPFFAKPVTARYFFAHYVDLEAVTEQDFFWMMSFFARNTPAGVAAHAKADEGDPSPEEEYRDRLRELANAANPDDFLVYSYREKRNVCEVLSDYNMASEVKVRPPLDCLLSYLTAMRPRLFSLSSAPALDARPTVSLTVAQLNWKTPMGRHRQGMCSSALVAVQPGDSFQCFFWEGTLTMPLVPGPLLLVATGSGVAPMRSLIRQCAAFSSAGWQTAPIYLFFGCRNETKDYIYAEEWRQLKADGLLQGLTVVPAFSRDDPARKMYVQHKLGQNAARIGSLLAGDFSAEAPEVPPVVIYVCGNAKNMPKDVQQVLQDVTDQVCCGGDEDAGAAFMKRLQREGRYQVDTWSA